MFSCWPLFAAEATFPFYLIMLWWIVHFCLIDICSFCCYFGVVFNLLISSSISFSFFFCCCLSSLALLVLEMVRNRQFPCFRCYIFGLTDRHLSCMSGSLLFSKLVVKFCLLEGLQLFLNISAYVGFSVFSVSLIVFAFICTFGLYFKLLSFLNFRCCRIFFFDASFDFIVFCISSYSFFPNCCLSIPSVWLVLVFVSLIVLSQKETTSSIKFEEKFFSLEYQLSRKLWSSFLIVGSSVSNNLLEQVYC